MTENQKKLIIFIHRYHSENGIIPSLIEIVDGIGVSDNKSALRVIESSIREEYLAQIGAKTSSVIPTYKALRELGLQPTLFANNLLSGSTTPNNDLVPSVHSIKNAESRIKIEGTQFDSNTLQNIVQSYINLALEKHAPEKISVLDILKNIPLNKQSELTISAIILLGFSVHFIGPDYKAIIATCGILFTIFIISNLSK